MRPKRGPQKSPSAIYVAKAMALSPGETELLRQRMQGRFSRRREDARLSATEVLALQLEFEDNQLNAWRSSLTNIRQRAQLAQMPTGFSLQQN